MKRFGLLVLLALMWLSLMSATKHSVFEHVEQDSLIIKAPVIYEEKVIFYIYSSLGNFTPFERSVIVGKRLEELSRNKVILRDSLNIHAGEREYTIRYGEKNLYTVGVGDSLILQQPLAEIAQAYYELIAEEFIPLFSHLNMRQSIILIVKTVLLGLFVLGLSVFSFRMLSKFIVQLKKLVNNIEEATPDGFSLKGIRVLSAEQFSKLANTVINFIRFVLFAFLAYFALYFLLLVIPPTRGIATQLQAYIMKPLQDVGNAILDYVPNLFFVLVVVLVSRYVLKFLRYVFDEIEKGHIRFHNFYPDWADSTYHIVKFLIIFFVIVIIFPYLPGSGSPAFQGISIFVGVLFSLGSSSAIANIIAGIILTYMRPFQIGDFVKIGDKSGILIETSLLVVRIQTQKNEEVTIPNAIVLAGNITDYSRYAQDGSLILHTRVSIGYDTPWQKVSGLLVQAALKSHGINKNTPPFVNITELKDYYVEYELNAFTDQPRSMPLSYAELHRNILDVFAEAGVEIMSPMYNAVRDGNQSTIPSQAGPEANGEPEGV